MPFSNATGSRHAAAGDVRRVAVENGQNVAHSRERAAWRAVIRISLSIRIQVPPYPRRVRLSVFCLARMNVNSGTVSRIETLRDSWFRRRNGLLFETVEVFSSGDTIVQMETRIMYYTDAFLGRTIDANLRELVI